LKKFENRKIWNVVVMQAEVNAHKKYKPNWLSSVAAMYSEAQSLFGKNVRVISALH